MIWEAGGKKAMSPVVTEFEKRNPGTKVDVEYVATDVMNSLIPTQLAAGSGPDLFRSDAGTGTPKAALALAGRGLLAPLSGDWIKDVPAPIAAKLSKDGKTYGFSTSLTGMGQLLNNDTLKKYGMTPPTTFSEVLAFCKDARDKGTVAYTAGPSTPFEARSVVYALSYQTVYAKNPNFDQDLKEGALTFQNSGWAEAVNKHLDMVKAGCFPDRFTGLKLEDAFSQLFSGQTLGMIGYDAYLQYAPEDASISTYPLPASENPDESGMVVSSFASIAMNAKAKNPALAQKFIDFLASEEINTLYVKSASKTGGLVPSVYDKSNPPQDQVSQQILTYFNKGKSNPAPDVAFPSVQVTAALEANMQRALAGDMTAEEVLTKVQAAYDQASKANP